MVLWQWPPFVDDSCLLRSTMGRLSHRWRRLVTWHQSNHHDQGEKLDHTMSNSLKANIICPCQGVWPASTKASPTSPSSPHSPSGISLALSSYSLLSWDRKRKKSPKQILPDTAFHASFIQSLVSSDEFPLLFTSSQSTNVLCKGFFEFVILKHACFNLPRDWFDWLFFCCKKLFRYPWSTSNGPDFTLWDHVLCTRKLESSVIDPESEIREKLISYKNETCCLAECVLFLLADGSFDTSAFPL